MCISAPVRADQPVLPGQQRDDGPLRVTRITSRRPMEADIMSERSAKEVVAEMFRRQQAGDDTALDDLIAAEMVNHAAGPQGRRPCQRPDHFHPRCRCPALGSPGPCPRDCG